MSRVRTDADILRAANDATGRTQSQFARGVLGLDSLSGYTAWIAHTNPKPALAPAVRLAWLITRHPELADEIETEFG